MKKIILGVILVIVLIVVIYFAYPFIQGLGGAYNPVMPGELTPGATAFGDLQMHVSGAGQPVSNLEVDLGKPGGRMSLMTTDNEGNVLFKGVSVGTYNIFFNDLNYPQKFERVPAAISVTITEGQTAEKNIELKLK